MERNSGAYAKTAYSYVSPWLCSFIALDLLYDIDPNYFLSHVESFIKSQLNEDRINLFLSNLSEYV